MTVDGCIPSPHVDVTVGLKDRVKGWFLEPGTVEHLQAADHLRREEVQGGVTEGANAVNKVTLSRVAPPPSIVGSKVEMTSDVFADVEMYESYDHGEGSDKTVFSAIDMTHTLGSSLFLKTLITNPICDRLTLEKRKRVLSDMCTRISRVDDEQPLTLRITETSRMREYEKDVMWAYRDRDEATSALYDIAYFKTWFMRSLNSCPLALSALNLYRIAGSPLIGVLSPILYFVVPYLILRYKAADFRNMAQDIGIPIDIPSTFPEYMRHVYGSFVTAEPAMAMLPGSLKWIKYVSFGLSMVFYFQALFNSFEISRTLRIVSGVLNSRMTNICRFFARASSVVKAYWDDDIRSAFFEDIHSPDELDDVTSEFFPEDEGDELDFTRGFNIGRGLARYKMFNHDRMIRLLRTYYAVDALMSTCRLVTTRGEDFALMELPQSIFLHPDDNNNSETNSDEFLRPSMRLERLWHPCILSTKAVKNNVEIDRDNDRRLAPNMLLTGPNAGGKSTLIKSIVITALMAQSVIVAPCARGSFCAPFGFINSQINVPDIKGKRSLFEEEMFRAKSNLEVVRRMGDAAAAADGVDVGRHKFSPKSRAALVVIDEIFSSTNPVEGISGAYSVAKHLALKRNCITVISTHYSFLCRLSHEKNDDGKKCDLFRNYQMPVEERASSLSPFVYPYKLRRGVCKQYIALELLKTHGFDEEVIDEAIRVKLSLTSPPPQPPEHINDRRTARHGSK